jgi:autotransporter-associated beta strand protein
MAAFYRKTPEELRNLLRRDRSLWVDRSGRLYYVCDAGKPPPAPSLPGPSDSPPVDQLQPLDQTFLLHSKPGANHLIYLDFVGFTISGTAWNANNNGGADIVAPPWDTDGNPNSFSNGELTAIQQIWLRVSEDYSPYDVDVTTEYPGEAALTRSSAGDQQFGTRALISPIGSFFGNPGGIAYVGAYDDVGDFYKPALIFPENLANSEKYIAEAISHEVGHNLGLSHDGQNIGATHVEYYQGQGNWAPIMGVGYYHPISQWSKGEYPNPSNTEDDLSVITQNGLTYRADDFGNTIGAATPLFGTSIVTNGVIERTNDVDFFSFQTGAGTAQITATPSERGANLHILLSVYNSGGILITNADVADDANGVHAVAFNLLLNSGTYYVSVEGIGSGDPMTTGYTEYGSLGQYTLAITVPSTGSWLPTPPGAYSWTNAANWLAGTIPDAADATASINNNIVGDQTINLDSTITIGRLLLGDADGSYGFTIQDGDGGPLTFDVVNGTATVLKAGGTNDVIAATLSLQNELVVSNGSAARLTLSGPINGGGGLTKTGAGLVTIAGTNAYFGNTTVAGGVLALDPTVLFPANATFDVRNGALFDVTALGSFAVNAGQTLGGRGAVLGDVVLNSDGNVSPGMANVAGTLTFSNNLTFSGGASWSVDLSGGTGSGSNDLAIVTGNLSLSGVNTIVINPLGNTLASPATYTILNYGGTLSGSAAANLTVSNPTRFTIVPDDSVSGQINLTVSGGATNLAWRGDGSANTWDVGGATNWFNGSGSDRFFQFDAVAFDDSGSNSPSVNLTGPLSPAALTVNASKNFTFAGSGKLSGVMSLTKLGSGTLTLNNANDFTGGITVSNGVLKVGNAAALGATTGATTISGSGTLDLNGLNLGAESVTAQGAGASGAGAIVNSSATTQLNALRFVTLNGDTTFGGTGRWDIRANPTASLTGNGFKLTKTGANEIWLVALGATGLGDIDVRQGLLGIQSTTTLGNPANTLTLASGASLVFWDNTSNVLNKVLQVTNATVRNDSGNNTFAGPATLNNSNVFNVVSALNLSGPINGSGSLLKTGTGTLTLSGSNTFTGTLYADTSSTGSSDGIVKLANSNALKNASAIIIRNNNSGSSTLQLDGSSGNMSLTQPITLNGRNTSSAAIENITGSNALTGNLTIQVGGGNYWFQSDGGTLALTGTLPVSTPGGTRTLTFQGNGDIFISGLLQNGTGGGTVALTKSGSGKLTITGAANSYTGTNTINAGTLQLGNGGAGGKLGPAPVINNGLLQLNRSDDFTWANDVSGASGQFIKLNTNTVTVTSTNQYLYSAAAGAAQVNGGTLQINPTGLLVANDEFWVAQNASTGACIVNGGTLIVSNWIAVGRNNSAANGTLTLNLGSIQKYGGGNIIIGSLGGTGTLTVNGGTLNNNAQLLLAESATGKGFFNLNGGVVQATALARFGGNNAVTRFNGGTLQATANSTNFISGLNSALIQAGGFVLDDAGFALTNAQSLTEDVSSTNGGFTKKGTGSVALVAANTFRGLTSVNAGTLRLGHPSALQFTTLDLNSADAGVVTFVSITSANIGGLVGSRPLALVNEASAPVALNVGANNLDGIYTGNLSGSGSLTKVGSGTLVLWGADTLTGATTAAAGTLAIHGVHGSSGVSVSSGATLGGVGVILAPVTIQAGGFLSPGFSIATLTISNSLTLAGTAIMEISHTGPANDSVIVSGILTYGGTLIVTNIGPALVAGDTFPLFNAGSFAGSFANIILPPLDPGLHWNTNLLATAGVISVAAPAAPQIQTSRNGTNLMLQFPTEIGVTYVLQSAPNLIAPIVWTSQKTNSGDGTFQSLSIPIDPLQSERYFRLQAF